MGNSSSSTTNTLRKDDRQPFIRLLLLKNCSEVYDDLNVCLDGIVPADCGMNVNESDKNKDGSLNTNALIDIRNIPDETLKLSVAKKCMSLTEPLEKCLGNERNQREVINNSWAVTRKPTAAMIKTCKTEYSAMKKCLKEGKEKAYIDIQQVCAESIEASTKCTAGILANEEKAEYRTSNRQFLYYI